MGWQVCHRVISFFFKLIAPLESPHQKHANLPKPDLGHYHRLEWAFMGAPCEVIEVFSRSIIQRLKPEFSVGYLDADHQESPPSEQVLTDKLTDKISFYQYHNAQNHSSFELRDWAVFWDALFVNGNHFQASRQIVFLDPRKEASLERKLDRLQQVEAFILPEQGGQIYSFLKKALPNWASIPVLSVNKLTDCLTFFREKIKAACPPVNGLILAGGKSTRMGKDKTQMEYHGMPQVDYLRQLLSKSCRETFVSVYQSQEANPLWNPIIEDRFLGLGPYGALLTAFQSNPNTAWLVVACDLPLLHEKAMEELIDQRNPSGVATAFWNADTGFPDPLCTLWEPKAYVVLLKYLSQGFSCPRKVLINSNIQLVKPSDPLVLKNANTPEDAEKIQRHLAGQRVFL